MRLETNDMRTMSEATRTGVSRLAQEAHAGRDIVLTSNSQPVAGVVSIDKLARMQHLDEVESDLRLLTLAWTRVLTDNGRHHRLEDVAAEFGVDLDTEDDESQA
ncbi:hypothetical protein [Haloactinomyces albus]|uniref:Antitoxin (DNA-binding transcriptional repressor) of toxin-antitoxin stability system n=1 Tax=Haloactinomyces albus TaxID=1352928 RepID=A0AAE4CKQ4_9ACTN|nr:hypothetical protein [Haloactinomyces albus]MDR7300611.1 antitoxin (DNA-binding transcriptional repressor) of toxin-antitoxin stability system [Haloactinomyces albus]